MTVIRRLKTRHERHQLSMADLLGNYLLPVLPHDLADAVRPYIAATRRDAAGGTRFVQIHDERDSAISDALMASREAFTAFRVKERVARSVGRTDQRMTLTQAEIGAALGLSKPATSRAFAALRATGAIFNPVRERGSITYEVDANWATRLDLETRAITAARQAQQRATAEQPQERPQLRLVDLGPL